MLFVLFHHQCNCERSIFCSNFRSCVSGTPSFASLDVHQCQAVARKDDLEALGYVLLYLVLGDLPWASATDAKQCLSMKANTSVSDMTSQIVCSKTREAIANWLDLARKTEFAQTPKYDEFESILASLQGCNSVGNTKSERTNTKAKENTRTIVSSSVKESKPTGKKRKEPTPPSSPEEELTSTSGKKSPPTRKLRAEDTQQPVAAVKSTGRSSKKASKETSDETSDVEKIFMEGSTKSERTYTKTKENTRTTVSSSVKESKPTGKKRKEPTPPSSLEEELTSTSETKSLTRKLWVEDTQQPVAAVKSTGRGFKKASKEKNSPVQHQQNPNPAPAVAHNSSLQGGDGGDMEAETLPLPPLSKATKTSQKRTANPQPKTRSKVKEEVEIIDLASSPEASPQQSRGSLRCQASQTREKSPIRRSSEKSCSEGKENSPNVSDIFVSRRSEDPKVKNKSPLRSASDNDVAYDIFAPKSKSVSPGIIPSNLENITDRRGRRSKTPSKRRPSAAKDSAEVQLGSSSSPQTRLMPHRSCKRSTSSEFKLLTKAGSEIYLDDCSSPITSETETSPLRAEDEGKKGGHNSILQAIAPIVGAVAGAALGGLAQSLM